MSRRTKSKVKWLRWIQLMLRGLALIGAIGMLIGTVCLRNVDLTDGWIIRIAPGVALVHCVYAIYHLARKASGRTPASSASYMVFAAGLDAGLVPFYVFTAILANAQHRVTGGPMDWGTVFNKDTTDRMIVYAVLLVSVVNAGLHAVSLVLDIYLAIIFRQISHLPPDMNPLEDNLTCRHKKRDSYMSEKRISHGSTLTSSSDGGLESRPISQVEHPSVSLPRLMPFTHTRTGSTDTVGGPQSRNGSTDTFGAPRTRTGSTDTFGGPQTRRQRDSRSDLPSQVSRHNARPASITRSVAAQSQAPSKRSSHHPKTFKSPSKRKSLDSRYPLIGDNWFTYEEGKENAEPVQPKELQHLAAASTTSKSTRKSKSASKSMAGAITNETENIYTPLVEQENRFMDNQHEQGHGQGHGYEDKLQLPPGYTLEQDENDDVSIISLLPPHHSPHPLPLEANPPTPPVGHALSPPPKHHSRPILQQDRSLSVAQPNQQQQQQYHLSSDRYQPGLRLGSLNRGGVGAGSFKAKLYGELKSATPPLMVGMSVGRREVSGKVAEEGRVPYTENSPVNVNVAAEDRIPLTTSGHFITANTSSGRAVSGTTGGLGMSMGWARFRKTSGARGNGV
ncbi:MAG: hypothetical protein M1838_002528 [Thelocarpon superellum]|nr:MAG: hypothetical protein M1838_002528 [Thelocarpon superellum]